MTTPTPEEFLALPSDPDEDDLDVTPVVPATFETGPLASIAASLETIAKSAHVSAYLDQQAHELGRLLDEARRDLADAEALNQVQADLIERVLEVVKPSTSKVAHSVREALGASPADQTSGHKCAQCDDTFPDVVALQVHGTRRHGAEFDYRDGSLSQPAERTGEHNNEVDAPPAADAPLEEWRAYARSRGYTGPDVDKANRSQIRTMLGLPHATAVS